jgi:hypothetical protein
MVHVVGALPSICRTNQWQQVENVFPIAQQHSVGTPPIPSNKRHELIYIGINRQKENSLVDTVLYLLTASEK